MTAARETVDMPTPSSPMERAIPPPQPPSYGGGAVPWVLSLRKNAQSGLPPGNCDEWFTAGLVVAYKLHSNNV